MKMQKPSPPCVVKHHSSSAFWDLIVLVLKLSFEIITSSIKGNFNKWISFVQFLFVSSCVARLSHPPQSYRRFSTVSFFFKNMIT